MLYRVELHKYVFIFIFYFFLFEYFRILQSFYLHPLFSSFYFLYWWYFEWWDHAANIDLSRSDTSSSFIMLSSSSCFLSGLEKTAASFWLLHLEEWQQKNQKNWESESESERGSRKGGRVEAGRREGEMRKSLIELHHLLTLVSRFLLDRDTPTFFE